MRENQRRALHECEVGQQVHVNNHFSSADELKPVWVGPVPISRVHTNGTITIQQGQIHERISIPQNGLVWVRPALLGRFGDSSELCSSQVW